MFLIEEKMKEDVTVSNLLNDVCSCGKPYVKIFNNLISIFSNIMINYYCKQRRDKIRSMASTSRKMMMQTNKC
jgi:hypothetical protein